MEIEFKKVAIDVIEEAALDDIVGGVVLAGPMASEAI
jgi:hypothetical protein